MTDAIDTIKSRHSTRYFDQGKEPSRADLEEVIRLAGLAPSWVDSQPWRVYLAMGETAKRSMPATWLWLKQGRRHPQTGRLGTGRTGILIQEKTWPGTTRPARNI